MTVRLAFLGNDPWSVPSLETIAGEPALEIVAVVTNPPRPAGRGGEIRPTEVAEAARRLGLPLVESDGVTRGPGLETLLAAAPDVLVVVAYGQLLTREVLAVAPLGALNLHFSLLPRWRGASPVQHALLEGDDVTGVTVMRMEEGLDTGPILNQLEEPVRPEDDAGTLGARLARLGGMLLVGVVRSLPQGGLPERPQDDAAATWAPRFGPDDRRIVWVRPAEAIVRQVRAFSPDPAASTVFRGEGLKVFAAAVAHDDLHGDPQPGTLEVSDERSVLVRAGSGAVRLLEVAPSGRKRMAAAAWARGARFEPGELLG